MYLVVKKTKRSPHSKIVDQTTTTFTNFESLEQWVLREGLTDCYVFEGEQIQFTLAKLGKPEGIKREEEEVSVSK